MSNYTRHYDDLSCPECGKPIAAVRIRQHIDQAHANRERKQDEGVRSHKRVARRAKAWWER